MTTNTDSNSDSRLAEHRWEVAQLKREQTDTAPSSRFGALRQWYANGSLRAAARERAGPLVIQVDRRARVPYEVASDPDVHCTAKHSKPARTAMTTPISTITATTIRAGSPTAIRKVAAPP